MGLHNDNAIFLFHRGICNATDHDLAIIYVIAKNHREKLLHVDWPDYNTNEEWKLTRDAAAEEFAELSLESPLSINNNLLLLCKAPHSFITQYSQLSWSNN